MKTETSKRPGKSDGAKSEENFDFGSARPYSNKDEIVEKELTFDIDSIEFEPEKGYDGADRWTVGIRLKGREPETLSFASNPKRDVQLRAAQAHLKRFGIVKNVRLVRHGNAYYLANAPT